MQSANKRKTLGLSMTPGRLR